MLIALLLPFAARAELRDPTQPPDFISSGDTIVTTWRLDAIIISENRRIAIINGQSLKIGEKISGNQLVDVQPYSVQLEGADGKITLFLIDNSLNIHAL